MDAPNDATPLLGQNSGKLGPRVAAARDLRGALSLARARGPVATPLTPAGGLMERSPLAPAARRFVAPRGSDDFGAFLGGVLLTAGTAPH